MKGVRYFAMIGGQQCGPYTLDELPGAGVRPDTYVWCKGMADWEKAEDVADICRYYRMRIFDMMHGGLRNESAVSGQTGASEKSGGEDPYGNVPLRFREFARKSGIDPGEFNDINPEPDISRPPMPTLMLALATTIFCSPLTGLIAVYYSFKSAKTWNESERNDSSKDIYTPGERKELKLKAYDYSRRAKMWIGISFFVGIIATALVGAHII